MKKLFALIFAIVMIATLSFTAFATNADPDDDRGVTVTYTVEPTYTVTIPQNVTINGTTATISAEDVVVAKGKYVSVSPADDNDFSVSTAEGATLAYTVTVGGMEIPAGGEILAVNPTNGKTGSSSVTFAIDESAIQYAGTYTGTATFTVAVKDVPVTLISFTIEAWTTLNCTAEEGMTWEEWIYSDYCGVGMAGVNNDGVYVGEGWYISLSDVLVEPTDVIQNNAAYVADGGY